MKKTEFRYRKILERAGAILFALLLWQAAAMMLNQSILLCTPIKVLERLFQLPGEKGFWGTVFFSCSRIIAGFFLAFSAGILLAVCAWRVPLVETILRPFVVSIKSIPVASFIVISLIWLSSQQLSIFISFLMVFPVIYNNVLAGLKNTDIQLLEMARLYKMPFGKRLWFIHLPHLKPFLNSACSIALGLSWKSGIAAEVIGIPNGSIGEMLYESKIYFDTANLFAWTVVIVLVSQLFERLFLHILKIFFERMEAI